MSNERFYISTPIYYPSDRLHIGHAYTTVVADSLARWHTFAGREVLFVTGSDEHGQKIERIAKAKGVQPQEYVDAIVSTFKQLWKRLNVDYDDFVRTTEPRHHKAVQTVFQKIYEKGDIYKSKYKLARTPCETFWVENKLHRVTALTAAALWSWWKRKAISSKSANTDRLLKHIEENPVSSGPRPEEEMVNFIKSGLEDLCVSRTTFDWGIPVPTNEDHVIYVWFDALTNYLTAAGYPDDQGRLAKWWPADVHLVGKEIMRFHTIIWPIILMALDLPLPKTVFGHGWLLFDNDKMSKSKGNVVDPNLLIDEFGVDPIRYFLMREISLDRMELSRRALIERTNADLANDLGNLLNRTLAMLNKYFDGVVPEPQDKTELDLEYAKAAGEVGTAVDDYLKNLQLNEALAKIWQLVGRANKYLDQRAPWALAKDESAQGQLATVMYNVVETLRIVALLVKSFLPDTGAKIWAQLGIAESLADQALADTAFGKLKPGTVTQKGDPIFPRIEEKDEEPEVEAKEEPKEVKPAAEEKKPEPKQAEPTEGLISIDDFLKCELVVGEVLAAEPVKGADRLLKLQVDVGSDKRQIVAGIALHYKPEELVGRRIIVVKNLKPAKLRGELSQGMLLAASTPDGKLELVSVSDNMPAGSRVK